MAGLPPLKLLLMLLMLMLMLMLRLQQEEELVKFHLPEFLHLC